MERPSKPGYKRVKNAFELKANQRANPKTYKRDYAKKKRFFLALKKKRKEKRKKEKRKEKKAGLAESSAGVCLHLI